MLRESLTQSDHKNAAICEFRDVETLGQILVFIQEFRHVRRRRDALFFLFEYFFKSVFIAIFFVLFFLIWLSCEGSKRSGTTIFSHKSVSQFRL